MSEYSYLSIEAAYDEYFTNVKHKEYWREQGYRTLRHYPRFVVIVHAVVDGARQYFWIHCLKNMIINPQRKDKLTWTLKPYYQVEHGKVEKQEIKNVL